MATATAVHDVFRLVSLRAAKDGLTIDPTSDDIAVPVLRELAGVDLDQPPAELVERARTWRHMEEAELRGLPWATLPGALDGDLSREIPALLASQIANVALAIYGATPEFLKEYGRLADSWLRLRLQRAWNVLTDDVALHERLIRVAHIIRRLARNPTVDRQLLGRLARAAVALPQTTPSARLPARIVAPPTNPRARREARRRELDDAKKTFARLAAALHNLESIQVKVHAALAERSATSDTLDVQNLDAAFYAALDKRLTTTERTLLNERIGSAPGARPGFLSDLFDALDVADVIVTANDWCSKIRVFEEEEQVKLPSAQPPQSGPRPSIRALGWGDLVVLRERLVGYDAREIAHIENVLAGEDKAREHERSRRTEELFETETFEQVETERDLQTSERFQLQTEAEKTIDTQFSVQAGVNVSGRYGLARVESSLEVGFQRSAQESQRRTTELAKEVTVRSVERVQQSVRELRRRVTIEDLRELNKHSISNTALTVGGPPAHRVGIYYWVEKIHEMELRQYGTRLMIEFLLPEPGLTLIEQGKANAGPKKPKPAPLAFGPADISAANFMCLTKHYGAEGVEPPPAAFAQTGLAWASEIDNSSDATDPEDTVAKMIKIPDGFVPMSGHVVVTGRGRTNSDNDDNVHAQVSVNGHKVLDSASTPKPTYTKYFKISNRVPVHDEGIPISIRIAGHDDRTATANLTIHCRRSTEHYQRWQLRTFEKIHEAHAALVREYEEAQDEASFDQASQAVIAGRPSSINRQIERDELKKWAVKAMRIDSFDFDAVVDEEGIQEIDPVAGDRQAGVVRFFEEAFEWREMSYFLYPYFWGRRAAWGVRNNVRVEADPGHEAFLRAGAARIVVPVTPGFEDRVLAYLESDPTLSDDQRIPAPLDEAPEDTEFPDLWLELLLNRAEDLALGDGTLTVTNGSDQVQLNESRWHVSERDLGRELYIGGGTYQVAAFDASGASFTLDRPYEGSTVQNARYATGTIPFGAPWLVRIPTTLVVLSDRGVDTVMPS